MNNESNKITVNDEEKVVKCGMEKPQSLAGVRPYKVGKIKTYDIMALDQALGYIKNKQAKEYIIKYIANIETEHSMVLVDFNRLKNENEALLLALEALGSKHKYMERDLDYYKSDRLRDMSVDRLSKSGDKPLHNVCDREIDF